MRRLLHAWEALLALSVALAMLIGLLVTSEFGLPFRLESLTLDACFRLRPVEPKPSPVVIVDIDDESIAEIGRWPWSRALFAQLLDRLAAAGAKVVVLDLLFTELTLQARCRLLARGYCRVSKKHGGLVCANGHASMSKDLGLVASTATPGGLF